MHSCVYVVVVAIRRNDFKVVYAFIIYAAVELFSELLDIILVFFFNLFEKFGMRLISSWWVFTLLGVIVDLNNAQLFF